MEYSRPGISGQPGEISAFYFEIRLFIGQIIWYSTPPYLYRVTCNITIWREYWPNLDATLTGALK